MGLTHRELEQRAGDKIAGKLVMYAIGDELWHRQQDGTWERYPDYPSTPVSKNE